MARLLQPLLLLAGAILAAGLYEEQAGQYDWRLKTLGRVSLAAFAPRGRPRVYVASEEAVVASLNARNGTTVWRQVLEPGDAVLQLVVCPRPPAVVTLSADGWCAARCARPAVLARCAEPRGSPRKLRAWSAADGSLLWERAHLQARAGGVTALEVLPGLGRGDQQPSCAPPG